MPSKKKKNKINLTVIFIIALLLCAIFNRQGFNLDYFRQFEQCFSDGQIPCRWSTELNHNHLNFVPPFSYYLTSFFTLFHLSPPTIQFILKIVALSSSTIIIFYLTQSPILSATIPLINIIASPNPLTFTLFLTILYLQNQPSPPLLSLILSVSFLLLSAPIPIALALLILAITFQPNKSSQPLHLYLLSLGLTAFFIIPATFQSKISLHQDTTFNQPQIIQGSGWISQFKARTNFWRFTADINPPHSSHTVIPIAHQDNWTILIDQKKVTPISDQVGQPIKISIDPGNHTIVGWLENTPLQNLANLITLGSFAILIIIFVLNNEKK